MKFMELATLDRSDSTGCVELRRRVLLGLTSVHSKRIYAKAVDELFALAAELRQPISRVLILEYRAAMQARGLSVSTVNVRLAAVRKLVDEAWRSGILPGERAEHMLADIRNLRGEAGREGQWLSRGESEALLRVPKPGTNKGKRDRAILALLLGCGLRRGELASLEVENIQHCEGRWLIRNLQGKGGDVRTVAVPSWVKDAIDVWIAAAEIRHGRLLRRVLKSGRVLDGPLSDWAVWAVVESSAKQIGFRHLGAHDLRRTCAKLCRTSGGEVEQIKFLLGHKSILTTERYLGSKQELGDAVNDHLGIQAQACIT